ncbi:MAG: TIGR01212 family radical SAM protein [Ruminiclostridium sp.]|nr:TIGR01212 family radical SAM protein [Ruminiclostridium sp.]
MSFIYSDDNKRYHTLYYHNKHTYGKRVVKAVIDAGFTCPNTDGSKGCGGCIFCGGGSGYFTAEPTVPITEQLRLETERIRTKYPDALINAYFQAHTNTYADIGTLERIYREAINSGVHGISIATRSDCIDRDKIMLIKSLDVPVTVELGVQTVHDETAARLNSRLCLSEHLYALKLLREHNIRTCVHIINGLPGETGEMMLETARLLGKERPDGVKIHLLHVIRGTRLHEMYEKGEYTPMDKARYIEITARQLGYFPPETVIERLTGDGDKSKLIAPMWSADKISVLGGIDKYMADNDICQGDNYE